MQVGALHRFEGQHLDDAHAVAEVLVDGLDAPAEMPGDVLDGDTCVEQSDCCCNAAAMRHQALDVQAQVVVGVGVGKHAGFLEVLLHVLPLDGAAHAVLVDEEPKDLAMPAAMLDLELPAELLGFAMPASSLDLAMPAPMLVFKLPAESLDWQCQ